MSKTKKLHKYQVTDSPIINISRATYHFKKQFIYQFVLNYQGTNKKNMSYGVF